MKTLILTLALSAAALLSSPQTAVAQSASATDDTAIKATIETEKEAGDAADDKAYLSHWARVPYASFLYQGQHYVGDML